jgi:hypothetical protein
MRHILCVVLGVVSLAVSAMGQKTRATLTGRVTDPTGAIVPNAPIDILDLGTGAPNSGSLQ